MTTLYTSSLALHGIRPYKIIYENAYKIHAAHKNYANVLLLVGNIRSIADLLKHCLGRSHGFMHIHGLFRSDSVTLCFFVLIMIIDRRTLERTAVGAFGGERSHFCSGLPVQLPTICGRFHQLHAPAPAEVKSKTCAVSALVLSMNIVGRTLDRSAIGAMFKHDSMLDAFALSVERYAVSVWRCLRRGCAVSTQ